MRIPSSFQKASWWFWAFFVLLTLSILILLKISHDEVVVQRELLIKMETIDAQVNVADDAQESLWSRQVFGSAEAKSIGAQLKVLQAERQELWQENQVHVRRGLHFLFAAESLLIFMICVNFAKTLQDRRVKMKSPGQRLPVHP